MTHNARLRWLTSEVGGGVLLLAAALCGLVWANSPWRSSFTSLASWTVGPAAWHLDLPLAGWAADGLLAVFFFVVGLELKHEIVAGSLRHLRQAAVPVIGAIGGMVAPAACFALIVALGDRDAISGWAIPTATDIAFALAVLAIFGRGLPMALRTFLLTLAVVDDLLAVVVIAVFYTDRIAFLPLAASLVIILVFALLARSAFARWWLLMPLGLTAWALMHASGVHATIAGVLLGLVVAARPLRGEDSSRAVRWEHAARPWSTVIALPVFAFFSAGVTMTSQMSVTEPVALAVLVGLIVGKPLGVLGTTALVTRLTPLRLADSIGLRDLVPLGFLTGIGFTVSLLIADLSFPEGTHAATAKLAVLAASLASAVLAAFTLRSDARRARDPDMNKDGVPDPPGPLIGD